jgi:hypothetical protein
LFATSPHASANAAVTIIGKRLLPIRFIDRFAWRVRENGVRHTRTIGSDIAMTTRSRRNEIASNNAGGTKNGG